MSNSIEFIKGDCLEAMRRMPERSVDLVITSPPYANKTMRYNGTMVLMDADHWVQWMMPRLHGMLRVCRGPVMINASGYVKGGRYHPAVELLIAAAYRDGVACERPCIWHKNAPPNRKDWFGNDWEFVTAFLPPDCRRVWNWEAVAVAPRFGMGGNFRQRGSHGQRRVRKTATRAVKLARPRDVWRITVGGGHMGSKLAHENEAPFPETLPERAILTLTNPGDTVLDPFSGSGTTCVVARRHGRHAIGIDIRQNQVGLGRRRARESKGAIDT